MDFKEEKELIKDYLSGSCTEAEQQRLEDWYVMHSKQLHDDMIMPDYEKLHHEIWTVIDQRNGRSKRVKLWQKITVAASILVFLSFGFYFLNKNNSVDLHSSATHDIAPGGNKAFLTLANGRKITLSGMKNGEVAIQSGVRITKTAEGELVYSVSGRNHANNEYNSIETPKGGQFQVMLPDGSKVWLNAATSIKYPSSFAGLINRKVELLSGEAYFEVAKDKKHPFIVKTGQQEVKVLGTHFNINAYPDEQEIKTTLLEGAVKISISGQSGSNLRVDHRAVNQDIILKPGEQSTVKENTIELTEVDANELVAWTNGKFVFDSQDMKGLMRQVARWYNVEVIYQDNLEDVRVSGSVSRFANISTLLEKLEKMGSVNFKLSGRTVTLSKK